MQACTRWYEQALAIWERRSNAAPDSVEPLSQTINTLLGLAYASPDPAPLIHRAATLADRVANLGGDTPASLYQRACIFRWRAGAELVDHERAAARADALAAKELLERLIASEPRNPQYQAQLIETCITLCDVASIDGNPAEGREWIARVNALAKQACEGGRESFEPLFRLAGSLLRNADLAEGAGDESVAREALEQARVMFDRLLAVLPNNAGHLDGASQTYMRLGRFAASMSEFQRAREYFAKGDEYCQRALADEPDSARFLFLRVNGLVSMCDADAIAGDFVRAEKSAVAAVAVAERLTDLHPGVLGYLQTLSLALERTGDVAYWRYDYARAAEYQRRVLSISERLLAANPSNLAQRHNLATTISKLSDLVAVSGPPEEARRLCESALASMRELVELDPGSLRHRCQLGVALHRVGATLQREGDLEGAVRMYSEMYAELERVVDQEPRVLHYRFVFGDACESLAMAYWLLHDEVRAREWTLRNLAERRQLAEAPEAGARASNSYAWALLSCNPEDLRDPRAAMGHARRAVELTSASDAAVLDTYALALFENGEVAPAVEAQEQAVALLGTQDRARLERYGARLERYRAAVH
jgi:tetratricopeptide (TPR) repeat protein